jgi:putative transposase
MSREICAIDRDESPQRKLKTAVSWRMDETYTKVKGKWAYYYRAIGKFGKTPDFMMSARRDEAAATAFFARAIGNNVFPDWVVIDKSVAKLAGLQNMNCLLLLNGWYWLTDILQVKYLNNIIEQDNRFIKKLTQQMKGFKSVKSASATLEGIEVAHMIRKRRFGPLANPRSNNSRHSLESCVQSCESFRRAPKFATATDHGGH